MEAITREEKLMDGQYVEPITRAEKILAGEDLDTVTRREYFLKKYRGGGGDISVVQLSVTENGVYTAPSGKAYSPVNVEVPTPKNAYFLKSVAGLPSDIASFSDGADMPLKTLQVSIEPVQDLHGYDAPWVGGSTKNLFDESYPNIDGSLRYIEIEVGNGQFTLSTTCPKNNSDEANLFLRDTAGTVTTESNGVWNGHSVTRRAVSGKVFIYYRNTDVNPTNYKTQLESGASATSYIPYENICPISGWTECNVTVCDDVDNPTVENEYTIEFTDGTNPLTVYGGTLDVVSGVLTVDRVIASGKVTNVASNTYANIVYGRLAKPTDSMNYGNTGVHNLISSMYYVDSATYNWDDANKIGKMFVGADYNALWIGFPIGTTLAEMQTITNDNIICYELATPQTIQLTPTAVASIVGVNNVSVDTGEVNEVQYLSREV